MSHIQSHHGGTGETHNTFLVILKVHGDAIQLWPRDKMKTIGDTHSFTISCHNVETHSDHPSSDIKVFVLTDPAPVLEKCTFKNQNTSGQPIGSQDLALFMTGPVSSFRKASYAIDLATIKNNNTNQDSSSILSSSSSCSLSRSESSVANSLASSLEPSISEDYLNNNCCAEDYCKLGTAYLYLDPNFSSQGIQRTPIIATSDKHIPIGHMQVEYLIVTNPIGYDQPEPRPEWLINEKCQLAGHRGAGSGRRVDLPEELLENTIDSFNYAHRHGADMCELDVVVSADGVPVVYHDFDVDAVAAQQKSEELGKFRVQVDQFTVKQLRDFRLLALHDEAGCPYTLNVPNQAETNKPFPTLAEVLEKVDKSCGLNIEVKWPQLLESGKMEARRYREINDFVDRIIQVVEKHAGDRRIVLESFDADLTAMLRLKQTKFPVIFLSQGMTDSYERYVDTRARSIWNGIYFAQAFDLAGIDLIAEYYILLGKKLVDFMNEHNLVARAWGDMGESNETLELLKSYELQCITYDKIDQR